MPDSLLLLRKTIGSSPSHALSKPRTAYFQWKSGDPRCFLGELMWFWVYFKLELGGFRCITMLKIVIGGPDPSQLETILTIFNHVLVILPISKW